jgi:hypothetical protein
MAVGSMGWDVRRSTGMIGLAWVVIQVASVVLFLTAGSSPAFSDGKQYAAWIGANSSALLGDGFLTAVASLVLLAVFAGLRSIIKNAGPEFEGVAALFFGAGAVTATILIVAQSVQAGVTFISGPNVEPAPMLAVYAVGQILLNLVYFAAAMTLGIAGYAVIKARILPRWVAYLGGVCAVLDLLAGLTIFGGTGSYGPFSLLPLLLGSLPVFVWFLVVSLVLVRSSRPVA